MHLRVAHTDAELLCKLYISLGVGFSVQGRLPEDPITTLKVPDETYDRLRTFVVDHNIRVELLNGPPGLILRDPR